jgi:hypothetical protein
MAESQNQPSADQPNSEQSTAEQPSLGQPSADTGRRDVPPPGGPEAVRAGCLCSVLLNQASMRIGGADATFVNPLCPVHGPGSTAGSGEDR